MKNEGNLALVPNDTEQPSLTPMKLIEMAVSQNADLDKMKQLMELQERWQANQARIAFNVAFAAFKAESVTLLRTKEITDGPLKGRKHVELGGIVKAATPALSKHGLSISWKLTRDEKDWMEVACTLRHVAGHSESVSMGAAPDSGPGRNAIQARGSAKTYLERYTATAILGLAPEDDDDGGAAGETGMPEEAMMDWLANIEAASSLPELQQRYSEAYKASTTKAERERIIAAKDGRKRVLQKDGAR